jgi:hypothetical protein
MCMRWCMLFPKNLEFRAKVRIFAFTYRLKNLQHTWLFYNPRPVLLQGLENTYPQYNIILSHPDQHDNNYSVKKILRQKIPRNYQHNRWKLLTILISSSVIVPFLSMSIASNWSRKSEISSASRVLAKACSWFHSTQSQGRAGNSLHMTIRATIHQQSPSLIHSVIHLRRLVIIILTETLLKTR